MGKPTQLTSMQYLAGGLNIIPYRLLLDLWAVVVVMFGSDTIAILFRGKQSRDSPIVPLLALIVFAVVAEWSGWYANRWTVRSFLRFHGILWALRLLLRHIELPASWWIDAFVSTCSVLSSTASAVLTFVLFPAVEISPAPHPVGLVDFHLPVQLPSSLEESKTNKERACGYCGGGAGAGAEESFVKARLLYPCERPSSPSTTWMLDPSHAGPLCDAMMMSGGPPPLKPYGWILYYWRLARLGNVYRDARPVRKRLPVAVFSHGLAGTAEIYASQTISLAAHGHAVLVLTHSDGSAPYMENANGSKIIFDSAMFEIQRTDGEASYVRARRAQIRKRTDEFLAATEALIRWSKKSTSSNGGKSGLVNDNTTSTLNLQLDLDLDMDDLTFMGHSMGAATALAAASRRPDLPKAVVAHDPATDWIPDTARRELFPPRFVSYNGGTGGYEDDYQEPSSPTTTTTTTTTTTNGLYDLDLMLLFSHEFVKKDWGLPSLFSEIQAVRSQGQASGSPCYEYGYVKETCHQEFSDTCALIPLWLARATGATGTRNPLDTAGEIAERTLDFLRRAREARSMGVTVNYVD